VGVEAVDVSEAAVATTRGWAENINRFPLDQLLRRRDFEIHERPAGKPAIWKRTYRGATPEGDSIIGLYEFDEAVRIARAEEKRINEVKK
jgi:hypothetical protein